MSKTSDIATIAVVALLGAGGFLIYKNRNEIGNFFGGIGQGVQNFTDGIGKGVGEFTDGIGSWYGETVTNIQQGVDDIGKNVGGFFDGVVNGFTETVTGIQSGIAGALNGAGDFLGETVTGIQSGIAGAVSGIGDFFGGLFNRDSEGTSMTPAPIEPTPEPVPEPVPAPEPVTTVLQNGKIVEKDATIKAIEKVSGTQVKEIIGAPSTLTKEERAKLPTKSFEELAKRTDFIGRVANIALKVKEGGYTGNILQNLKK